MKKRIWYAICFVLLIAFDQITKISAIDNLKGNSPFPIIKNIFELSYVENRGAAFGMFQGKYTILSIISVFVIGVIVYIFFKIPSDKKYSILRFTLVLLSAGAVGNLIDRVFRGYVVDFFYFMPINFPVFNMADIYVSCSAVVLIILILFVYKDDDILISNK